jgi:hypothetical protein
LRRRPKTKMRVRTTQSRVSRSCRAALPRRPFCPRHPRGHMRLWPGVVQGRPMAATGCSFPPRRTAARSAAAGLNVHATRTARRLLWGAALESRRSFARTTRLQPWIRADRIRTATARRQVIVPRSCASRSASMTSVTPTLTALPTSAVNARTRKPTHSASFWGVMSTRTARKATCVA